MKRLPVLLLILWLFLPSSGAAQKRPAAGKPSAPAGYKLLSLNATGTTRYTGKEILAASGLQIGENAAEGDFKEAARRLGDSGVFSDVAYSFSYSDAGVKVEFQLTDTDQNKLVPAQFENFVWLTDAELFSALAQRVPLFKQLLPVHGKLADQVEQALQATLNDRQLLGRVSFQPEARQEEGDLIGFVYRVEEVSIRFRKVEFPGATPDQIAFLTTAAQGLSGIEYSRSSLAAIARHDLLPKYLERGYLKAAFGPSDARVVAQSAEPTEGPAPNEVEVDALLPVTPGKQYSVSGVNWKGTSAVTTAEASPLFHLTVGQPADAVRIARDAERLTKLYRSRGYMTAQIKPEPQMDDDKSTVQYDMNVTEGDLYSMGELEILGLDTPAHDRLREAWKLREGQPYDADYTRKFLDDTGGLLPRGAQYSVKVNEELVAKDKTVDVTIHFKMQ